jgi:hypothetical protein
MKYPEITEKIIVAALKVHSAIGPGVLESVYKTCLTHELKQTGIAVSSEGASSRRVRRIETRFRVSDRPAGQESGNCGTQVCRDLASNPQSAVADVPTTLQQTYWFAFEFQCRPHA